MPSGKSCSVSLMMIFGMRSLLRGHRHGWRNRFGGFRVDPFLDDVAEVLDEPLHRPGRGVTERADGMAFDLFADVEQHLDFGLLRIAVGHALQHAPHPARAFAARRALAARFVFVEIGDAGDGADHVGGFAVSYTHLTLPT